ncbi:hypothetical protein K1719_038539 [Acacia pycnantha]|nr:hypothetical protein K1719_038539 [Acacia pycnantha]
MESITYLDERGRIGFCLRVCDILSLSPLVDRDGKEVESEVEDRRTPHSFSTITPTCLKYINVAMVMILKNVTNVITTLGEMYVLRKHHDDRVWTAMFLMIISAISVDLNLKLCQPLAHFPCKEVEILV